MRDGKITTSDPNFSLKETVLKIYMGREKLGLIM